MHIDRESREIICGNKEQPKEKSRGCSFRFSSSKGVACILAGTQQAEEWRMEDREGSGLHRWEAAGLGKLEAVAQVEVGHPIWLVRGAHLTGFGWL